MGLYQNWHWRFLKDPAWWFSMFVVGFTGLMMWGFVLTYRRRPIVWIPAVLTYAGVGLIIVMVYHEHSSKTNQSETE